MKGDMHPKDADTGGVMLTREEAERVIELLTWIDCSPRVWGNSIEPVIAGLKEKLSAAQADEEMGCEHEYNSCGADYPFFCLKCGAVKT